MALRSNSVDRLREEGRRSKAPKSRRWS